MEQIRKSLSLQHELEAEFAQLQEDRTNLRNIVSVTDQKIQDISNFHLPVNIGRLLWAPSRASAWTRTAARTWTPGTSCAR